MNAHLANFSFPPRVARESPIRELPDRRTVGHRSAGRVRRDARSRRHSLPPTRAARSSRSRGVFFSVLRRALSVAAMAVAMLAVAAMLGTAKFVDSTALNDNAGPRLVASASLAPPPFAAPRR
ncbi:MAG TPA: hypothetical protein VGK37_05985 [Casimicrobiaceae bacterium]